jgi:ferredoxin-like protein FixX
MVKLNLKRYDIDGQEVWALTRRAAMQAAQASALRCPNTVGWREDANEVDWDRYACPGCCACSPTA